jgi:hypothetical protein
VDRSTLDDFDLSIRALDLGPDYRVDLSSDEPRRDEGSFTASNLWAIVNSGYKRRAMDLQFLDVQWQVLAGNDFVASNPTLRS